MSRYSEFLVVLRIEPVLLREPLQSDADADLLGLGAEVDLDLDLEIDVDVDIYIDLGLDLDHTPKVGHTWYDNGM